MKKIPVIAASPVDSDGCDGYLPGMELQEMINRLVVLLKRRGYTQEQFESMVGLSKNRISKWVGGQGEPTGRQLWRMAQHLNVPIEHFLSESIAPDGAGTSDFDYCVQTVRRLGTAEALYRLLGERHRPSESREEPVTAAPRVESGQSLHPPVRGPQDSRRRARGA